MQRRCPSIDNAPAPAQTSAIHPRRSSPTARRDWAALVTKPAAEYTAATSWPAVWSQPLPIAAQLRGRIDTVELGRLD